MIKISIKSKNGREIFHVEVSSFILKVYPKEKIRNALLEFCKDSFDKHKPNRQKFKEELGIDIDNLDYVIENPEVLTDEYEDILSGNLSDNIK